MVYRALQTCYYPRHLLASTLRFKGGLSNIWNPSSYLLLAMATLWLTLPLLLPRCRCFGGSLLVFYMSLWNWRICQRQCYGGRLLLLCYCNHFRFCASVQQSSWNQIWSGIALLTAFHHNLDFHCLTKTKTFHPRWQRLPPLNEKHMFFAVSRVISAHTQLQQLTLCFLY